MGLMKEAIADVTQIQGLVHERNRMADALSWLEHEIRFSDTHAELDIVFDKVQNRGVPLIVAVEAMYGSK